MAERLTGRVSLEDVRNSETGELILERNEEISAEKAKYIESLGITSVWVRSPLTCGLRHGICRMCYGRDLATRKKVAIGESVGVVAAQSIGEPGTQLTMRTFHSTPEASVSSREKTSRRVFRASSSSLKSAARRRSPSSPKRKARSSNFARWTASASS